MVAVINAVTTDITEEFDSASYKITWMIIYLGELEHLQSDEHLFPYKHHIYQ